MGNTPAEAERSANHTDSDDAERPQLNRRLTVGGKEIVFSVFALLVVVGLIAWFGGGLRFSPGGPYVDPSAAPSHDARAELTDAAGHVPFPIRVPIAPAGWRSNSGDIVAVPGGRDNEAVQVGWITGSGNFLRLSQSNGSATDLVREEAQLASDAPVASTGETTVHGVTWTFYPGLRQEPAWVANLDGERLLITGSATRAEFTTMATAVATARALPGNSSSS
ncbi:MAG: DUF4245 domain-containing protein [Sciscionella sp.]|nr:DUF4245 domain-containing protein [Sciscionella sp.]